jgi:hypothetical protein
MSRIRLYFDEDAMQQALVVALRARHVDVLTASDSGMINRSDEEHLTYATHAGLALYSFNIKDYAILHEHWMAAGRAHSGIILAPQQRFSIGDQVRRLLRILNRIRASELQSRLEYLSHWGP